MWRILICCFLSSALAACGANFTTAFRTYTPVEDGPRTALIDAKQRAILAAHAETTVTSLDKRVTTRRGTVFCAEPSPDALSAISSSLSASFGGLFPSGANVQAALAQALSETASQLGVRNATIQLLRDGLYRQCEAYMNGLIDSAYYDLIANKYVNAMVALLAIEQLAPVGASATTIRASDGGKVETSTNVNVASKPVDLGGGGEKKPDPADGGQKKAEPATGSTTEKVAVDTTGDKKEAPEDGGQPEEQSGGASANSSAPAPVASVNLPAAGQRDTPVGVSKAVSAMVTWFLNKDTVDYCLRQLYTLESAVPQANQAGPLVLGGAGTNSSQSPFVETCQIVIERQTAQQGQYLTALATPEGSSFGADGCSAALANFWMPNGVVNQKNQEALKSAMQQTGIDFDFTSDMINTKKFEMIRREVGQALELADCS